MYYRLLNSSDERQAVTLTLSAWQQVLELAEAHGWNPLGTVELDSWLGLGGDPFAGPGSYTPGERRLVLLDDAINLAEALDRAFLEHEPLPLAQSGGIFQTEWDSGAERVAAGHRCDRRAGGILPAG